MTEILIDEVAYLDDESNRVNESRVQYYVDLYKDLKIDDKRLPTIAVRKVNGGITKKYKGGNKYIIQDGRHRMIALKRLGHKKIKANIRQ